MGYTESKLAELHVRHLGLVLVYGNLVKLTGLYEHIFSPSS